MSRADEPAFPLGEHIDDCGGLGFGALRHRTRAAQPGVSKRELAAFMAMQGLLANAKMHWTPKDVADLAKEQADALLAALEEKKP